MDASYCLCVLLFGKQIHEPISLQGDTFLWFYPVFLSSCSVMLSRCASRGIICSKKMNPAKRGEASGFQFLVMHGSCEGECLLSIRQGTRRSFPHDGCDQSQIPCCFGQCTLIWIDLSYLQGVFKVEACLWLIVGSLDGQDGQAVERPAGEGGERFVLHIGEQLFIGSLGLFPGVLEDIGSSQ